MVKANKLKKGEVLSEKQFYKVERVEPSKVILKNDDGQEITVGAAYVEKCLNSAAQHNTEKFINKTEAAAKFLACSGTAITVNFNKQVKESDVIKEIMDTYGSSSPKEFESALKKSVKGALQGVERTMVGRHTGELNDLGRVQFIDMEEEKTPGKDYDSRLRQVDPRGINWFITGGVKYTVK